MQSLKFLTGGGGGGDPRNPGVVDIGEVKLLVLLPKFGPKQANVSIDTEKMTPKTASHE